MLLLLFKVGGDRYALDARRVVEVIPLLQFNRIPRAPRGVAGLFNYRGQPVPAVDLSELMLNRPAGERLSTRIIIVEFPDAQGVPRLVGVIAEQATDLVRREVADLPDRAEAANSTPILGAVELDRDGVIQRIRAEKLIPENIREALFSEAATHESH
jgi:chemotaxis-related protein WspB